MKKYAVLFFILLTINNFPQTLIESFPFPQYTYYNYFWGLAEKDGYFWIGSSYTPSSSAQARLYKVSKTGIITDSISTPINSNCGVEWDGTNFRISINGPKIYKISTAGAVLDSFVTPNLNGSSALVGDITKDGNKLWYSVFSPDFVTYPQGYAFAVDLTTNLVVDTIPLRGRQVLGIASKGDTIFYVNENQYASETERIYAYSKTAGDTIFSFPAPDPDGNCNPKGLYWDGEYLWLLAERIGGPTWVFKTLYKYDISGQGSPIISVAPLSIDFGAVLIDSTAESFINISNNGNADLIINNFVFDNPVFSIPGVSLPDTIPPGGDLDYPVHFIPAQYDSAFGNLAIHSNDGGTPIKNVSLKGKGVYTGAFIFIQTDNYNFGSRRINSYCGYDIEIENRGNIPLQINSISTSTSRFYFDTTGVQYPFVLQAESSRKFKIWFNPNSTGSFNDSLVINSDAVNQPVKKFYLSGSGFENPAVLGNILWQMDLPLNPNSYSNDTEPTSLKKIDDVNNDGINDLVVTTRNYYTHCINGNSSLTGDVIWSFDTGYNNDNTGSVGFHDAMQIRSDVNGDGIQDVVIGCGGGNEFVYTICGRTGNQIWAYGDSINYSNGDINGIRADKDFNGDGSPDVLISASGSSTGGRHAAICLDGITGSTIFNSPQPQLYTFDVVSLQNGGAISVDQNNGGPYFINAFNNSGAAVWSAPVPEIVWSLKETQDVNNDGIKDIVGFSGGINVNVYSRSGANGSVIWNIPFPNFATFANIRLISDLDSNGFDDMIFSGKEGVYRIDTKTGSILWNNNLDFSYTFGVDEIVDLNGDGYKELLAGTFNAYLYMLDGLTGAIMFQHNTGSPNGNAVERVLSINSIDGNYSNEFACATDDGRIILFSGGPFVPVPVELSSFTASVTENNVILKWSTVTELNNKGFEIERINIRSLNKNEIIAFIPGKGTTSEISWYAYSDNDPGRGSYIYKLNQMDYNGYREEKASVEADVTNLPERFSLEQNYPNPFNPVTTIKYSLAQDSRVTLLIFNSLGEAVEKVTRENSTAGYYEYEWSAGNNASGVYYYSLEAAPVSGGNNYYSVKKMLLIK